MIKIPSWSGVVAVHNDEKVLRTTLLKSPSLGDPGRLLIKKGFETVAQAYNAGLRESRSDVVVFLHTDVYLPESWEYSLNKSLEYLDTHDPNWGVAGLFGIRRDGSSCGFLYSAGRQGFLGAPLTAPQEVRTVDEFVFAIRRNGGLSCDEQLPSGQFQLGATDMCLEAEKRGMKNYVLPCFTLHNSNRWSSLPLRFWSCYLYVRAKWKPVLPVQLPYATITRGSSSMVKTTIRHVLTFGRCCFRTTTRVDDPVALYASLRNGLSANFNLDE